MSTKASHVYEEGKLHLYEDLMDPGFLFLKLEGEAADFKATKNRVTVRIPGDIWERIRKVEIIHPADMWAEKAEAGQ